MEKNATLAFIRDEADLTALLDGKFYFTTHAMPGTSGAATHANITDYCDANAGAVCAETPTEDCAVVGKTNYQFQSCADTASHYVCMYPPYCPSGYSEYMGGCYQAVKDFGTTPLEALTHCGTLGGALAVPPNVATMEFLDLLVKKLQNGTSVLPTPALIGLNNALNGDFTLAGLYTVGDDVTAMATGPEPYYALNVQETSAALELVSIPIDKADLTTAVCQFPGYKTCNTEPPPPSVTMSRVWDNSTAIGASVLYTCYPGYFVNGNISLTNNTVACYGQLGEWLPSESASCIVVDVCNDTTLPIYDEVVVTKSVNHTHLNGTAHFACPADMGAFVNTSTVTEQNSTCISTLDTIEPYAFSPMAAPCNVCLAEPILVNATSDWVNTTVWFINMTVTVTCDPGSEWALLNDTQIIECNTTGWTIPMPCYPVCADLPPEAGSNMTWSNMTSNELGATVTYNCTPGYYFTPTPQYPNIVTSKTLTCSSNMTWQPADYNLTQCVQREYYPFSVTKLKVTLSCPPGYKLGDGNETKVLTCQNNGNWTTEDLDLMICRTPVTVPLPALPPEAQIEGLPPGGLIWQDLEINFTCPNNTMSTDGRTYLTLVYNGSQWLGYDASFVCLNTCQSDPMPPYNTIRYNYTGVRAIGSVVAYYCAAGRFINMEPYYYSYCDGEEWNLTDMPTCECKFASLKENSML
ncbi:sushi, von Willebrand factor type A, EGF and pentraxin domain-containing protein 1-like [Palaemon carinicauda]|uniref:sushi, von Willebrand factor type A, EGF and pentraxin domain-containing protein 1-like n=1 Tax=Palaemon carinicauda TaxID=392227 RepID=UPI0035B5E7E0